MKAAFKSNCDLHPSAARKTWESCTRFLKGKTQCTFGMRGCVLEYLFDRLNSFDLCKSCKILQSLSFHLHGLSNLHVVGRQTSDAVKLQMTPTNCTARTEQPDPTRPDPTPPTTRAPGSPWIHVLTSHQISV